MKKAAMCVLILSAAGLAQPDAVIEVDAAKIVHPIPRTIYGAFLEPLRSSIQTGGLWAQVLGNPSFEDNLWSAGNIAQMIEQRPELAASSRIGIPLPWESLDPGQGSRFEPRWNDAANSYRSLLIMALPGRQTGVRQQVYLPVHRVLQYTGSLYAKPVSGGKELEVSLRRRNRQEEVFAKAAIRLTSDSWTRYEFALDIPKGMLASREPADFVVAASDEARVLVDQVFLFPADNLDGLNREMIEMARPLQIPVLRFGGNYTSGYHWRDGIGPIDKRITMLNQAWGMPEYNHFGTEELLRLCKAIGAEPQIALKLGSGTAVEAAEWVRYVNARWGDQSGGLSWELGNELWGLFQIGYPTLERVAARTRDFIAAVRQVDPRARLIATGEDPDRFERWNAAQLALEPGSFEYLSTHFIAQTADVQRANPTRDFIAQAALALPVGMERQLREMKKQIDADPRTRDRVKIAFTEWRYGATTPAPDTANMGGALCAAGFLNTLMRVADFTPIANMTSILEFGRIPLRRGPVYGPPSYWAFLMYSTADASRLVDARTQVEHYNIDEGIRRLPTIHDVPYLDVVAAVNEKGDKLTLFAVNRHLTREISAVCRLSGFNAGAAAGKQLSADSVYAVNDEIQPTAVAPVELNLKAQGSEFRHVFPPASVTVIELRRKP